MKIYNYLQIGINGGIQVGGTDKNTLDWIVEKVNEYKLSTRAPAIEIEVHSDHPFYIVLKKLGGQDHRFMWQIIHHLGRQGWEPFAVTSPDPKYYYPIHHFRKEEEAEKNL